MPKQIASLFCMLKAQPRYWKRWSQNSAAWATLSSTLPSQCNSTFRIHPAMVGLLVKFNQLAIFLAISYFANITYFLTVYTGFTVVKSACCGLGNLNAKVACLPISGLCSNRSNHMFWDLFHPTETTAGLLTTTFFEGSPPYVYPINVKQLSTLWIKNVSFLSYTGPKERWQYRDMATEWHRYVHQKNSETKLSQKVSTVCSRGQASCAHMFFCFRSSEKKNNKNPKPPTWSLNLEKINWLLLFYRLFDLGLFVTKRPFAVSCEFLWMPQILTSTDSISLEISMQ